MNHRDTDKGGGKTRTPRMASLRLMGMLAVCLGILVVATALRFHNLGAQSLWNDEGSSYVQATRSFAEIAANAARDIHPPGYYWLLAAWRGLAGESEFALRVLSAFASVLSVAFTFAIGRRLFSPAAGLAAALLVALNTFSIYYAQEARMYALLALWAAAGMWMVVVSLQSSVGTRYIVSALSTSTIKWIVALGVVNVAGLYTQYAYPFIMLAQGLVVVVWVLADLRRRGLKPPANQSDKPTKGAEKQNSINVSGFRLGTRYSALGTFILANLLTLLLYLPWLPTALRQVTQWPSTGSPIAADEALGMIGGWFTLGITYTAVPNAVGYLPLALLLLAGGVLGWVWLKLTSPLESSAQEAFRKGENVPRTSPPDPLSVYREGEKIRFNVWRVIVPLIWAGLPVVLFLVLGLFRPANLKFLLPAQIGFALLLGAGLAGWWELARRGYRSDRITLAFTLLQGGWLLAYLVNGLTPLYEDAQFQRADYRAMAQMITADPREGDAIILDAPNQEEVFRYYYRGDAPLYPLPAGLGGDDAATRAQVQGIIANHQRIFVLFWGEAERDPQRIVETTLDNQTFAAGDDQWYGDVRLARYVAPATMGAATTTNARFGDSIMLERYATSERSLWAGDVLQVRLEWRTETTLTTRYKVFVQLLNSSGVLVAQRDSEPVANSVPTTTWAVGETVIDQHGLAIPSDLPVGRYQVIIGLYNIDDPGQRLAVRGQDYLLITEVTVR